MPLYIVHTRPAQRKITIHLYHTPSRDMGALARGARALCAYPSREELRVKRKEG